MPRFRILLIALLVCIPSLFLPSLGQAQAVQRVSLDDEVSEADDELADDFVSDDVDEDETDEAADDASQDAIVEDESTDETPRLSVIKGHGLQLGMTFLGIPGSLIENWFSEHGNTWENGAVNMGVTLDYFLRFQAPCELRFTLSWNNARTGSAFWLDKNYADRPHLADYVVNNMSIISLEVAAYHVVRIIDEVAFYYGGGLWGGLILDDAKSYAIRYNCANTADDLGMCPHEPGAVPLSQMPAGFGFISVTLGFKFTLADIFTIRAEGGFKGYLYGQLGLGVEF